MKTKIILPDLLTLTAHATTVAEGVCDVAKDKLLHMVSAEGRVVNALFDDHQTAAHGFAWVATYVESLRQMQRWAEALTASHQFGEVEQLIHQIAF